ncbi:PKD domain-containing protein [Pseudochryseolinea flava]|uniref:PKD domain-containing protein n=1 Tax=Pseudochryseolinea flava TaxID=2059302 RepID=UPI0014029D62|nr:PKD domain-containing protein [Pseudochryseolinea flava]
MDFDTDQSCAPVTVTKFIIRYTFTSQQNPDDISIVYEWNDPGGNRTVVSGAGLTVTNNDRVYEANATFVYNTNNGRCSIQPSATLYFRGVACLTSRQVQAAFFWSTDDQANGVVAMAPDSWDVCYENPIVNAQFRDASNFNCNIVAEPDNPNRETRHMQFVYGTNHNAAATIRNLTLTDGGAQPLTDGAGNLVNVETRGTGVPVQGAYFGPIVTVPVPADAPTAVSFPMNAPMNLANIVGNQFEVTLYNWNVCNPWNGDANNPNYEDAIATTGYITIVAAPTPAFFTRDALGNARTSFCIGEDISFRNQTPNVGANAYRWEFYDDAAGTIFLRRITSQSPTFSFATGGQKLVRLTAISNTAQGTCEAQTTRIVNITPALVADIAITDLANNPISGDFCQETTAPLTPFNVRFSDVSAGVATPTTRWRWEFVDQNGNVSFQFPAGGGYASTQLGPFDRVFTTPGLYKVRLFIRDSDTGCETDHEDTVRIFEKPRPAFTFNRVCIGNDTHFEDASTINPIIPEETIVLREWDMNFDGTFDADASLNDETSFDYTFTTSGTHRVALRLTTSEGECLQYIEQDVLVDPLPNASIAADVTTGCSVLEVTFTNNSIVGQPDGIREYYWEFKEQSETNFEVESIQRPTDPGFGNTHQIDFENTTSINKVYDVRLRVVTVNGCEQISNTVVITVNPGPNSGFASLNYSPFDNNCSPVTVNFAVDNQTRALNPTDYEWTVSDASGVISQVSTGTIPTYTHVFPNTDQIVKNYQITLSTTLVSGCSEDSTRIIQVSPIPSGTFVVNTLDNTCQKTSYNFEATQKGLVEYEWTILINNVIVFSQMMTDDNIDYEVNKTGANQNLEIRLRTRNVTNCQSIQESESIVVPRSTNLVASFMATPTVQTLPNATVTITNTSTPGPWQYAWDFGDNNTSTSPTVSSHTYTQAGTYAITLTISDNSCSSLQTVMVQINPTPPIVDFSYDPPRGCAPLTVDFTNLSQFADPSTYVWQFGANQGSSNAVNPSYTYFEPGIYTVSLTAANTTGDVDTEVKSMIIEVLPSAVAQFSVYPNVLDLPGDILYTNNRSAGATGYLWDFGDNTTSDAEQPTHKYEQEGNYIIQLIAYGPDGCNDTTQIDTPVKAVMSGRLAIPNAFRPNLSGPGSTNKLNNEVFIPLMTRVSKFQMLVFNRWGTLMFESSDQEVGWDGYYKGQLCPQDVYVYKLIIEYDDGKSITQTGDINLIR